MPSYRTRNWVFKLEEYESCPCLPASARYVTYGFFTMDDGRRYIHGFIVFKSERVKPVWFLPRAKWAPMSQTIEKAIKYVHRNYDYIEHGSRPFTQVEKGYFGGNAAFQISHFKNAAKRRRPIYTHTHFGPKSGVRVLSDVAPRASTPKPDSRCPCSAQTREALQ